MSRGGFKVVILLIGLYGKINVIMVVRYRY